MTTAQSSYVIAMELDSLATAIGDTNAYDILDALVGIEISEEEAGQVRQKLDEMHHFIGRDIPEDD